MAITFHANGTIEGLNNNNFRASMPSGSVLQVVESSYSGRIQSLILAHHNKFSQVQ